MKRKMSRRKTILSPFKNSSIVNNEAAQSSRSKSQFINPHNMMMHKHTITDMDNFKKPQRRKKYEKFNRNEPFLIEIYKRMIEYQEDAKMKP